MLKALAVAAIATAGIGAGTVSADDPCHHWSCDEDPDINILIGTPDPDLLIGSRDADFISGRGAPDFIVGRGGDDILWGMWGNDRIHAGGPRGDSGSDIVRGGPGNDICFIDPSDVIVTGCETIVVQE